MTRKLVFDPTTGQTFVDQWQRWDWQLLQNSNVHRLDSSPDLHRAVQVLADLGYLVHQLDASGWLTEDDLHDELGAAMSFPDYYGANLDALDDVLRDVAGYEYGSDPETTGTVLAIDGYDQVVRLDGRLAHTVLDLFAMNARYGALLGHPMLCLVTTTVELAPVGAVNVVRSVPPRRDPPARGRVR